MPIASSSSSAGCRDRAPRTSPGLARWSADGIAAMLPHARASGVPLAIEPLHPMYAADRACVNTIDQALDHLRATWGRASASPSMSTTSGGTLSLSARPSLAPAGDMKRIYAHHICDWLVPTTDMLLDRGMMGDGVIDLQVDPPDDRGRRLSRPAGGRNLFSRDNWWKKPRRRSRAHLRGAVPRRCAEGLRPRVPLCGRRPHPAFGRPLRQSERCLSATMSPKRHLSLGGGRREATGERELLGAIQTERYSTEAGFRGARALAMVGAIRRSSRCMF